MTTVNSPACLLARNFYRTLSSPAEPLKPTCSCQDRTLTHRQTQVTLWVTIAAPAGLMGTKDVQVNIVLRSPSSLRSSATESTNPADRRVK